MNSPIPFYTDVKYRDKCRPCHTNKTKFYELPVPTTFIPYQICLEGEYNTVSSLVTFYDCQDAEIASQNYCIDLEVCNGKTYITNRLQTANTSYEINSENWLATGGVVFGTNTADIDNGALIESAPLPIGVMRFCVDMTGPGQYEIRLDDGSTVTTLVTSAETTTHCFDIEVTNGTTTIIIEYLLTDPPAEDTITAANFSLCVQTLPEPLSNCDSGYATMLLDGNINIFSEFFKVVPQNELDQCHIKIDYSVDCAIDCYPAFGGFLYVNRSNEPLGPSVYCNPEYFKDVIGEEDQEGKFITNRINLNKAFLLRASVMPQYMVDFLNLLVLFDLTITIDGISYDVSSSEAETEYRQCSGDVRLRLTTDLWSRVVC